VIRLMKVRLISHKLRRAVLDTPPSFSNPSCPFAIRQILAKLQQSEQSFIQKSHVHHVAKSIKFAS
jgi:hypothetical protein